jgi:hypothetical protein
MRSLAAVLTFLLLAAVAGAAQPNKTPAGEAPAGEAPAFSLVAHKQGDTLGTFRASFTFPGGWRPERDVLIVLAPFANRRDREGKYDPARLFEAAQSLVGALGDRDRVNVATYRDLLGGETWFPDAFPFVPHADDLFVRPVVAFDAWQTPAEALAGLDALRGRGVETLRNTSYLLELLRSAALAFEPNDGRVKEIIVLADSHTVPVKGFFEGLPVEVPAIKLEPLDPEWTSAFCDRLRSGGVHVNFIAVAHDEKPEFRERRLRRMAETTHGFYFEWPDDEAACSRCVGQIAAGLWRGLEVDLGASDANYVYTSRWFPGDEAGFVVYGRYGRPGKYTFTLRDTLGGREWRFDAALPAESAEHAEIEAAWARQRMLDGVWRLATFGPDDYLTYDLQQLAHRYGLALPEALGPSLFEAAAQPQAPAALAPEPQPHGTPAPEPPVLDETAEVPAHSALAEIAPYDMIYVRYGRVRSALELLDMGYFYGRDVIQALGLHPDITLLEDRVQTQLCMQISRSLTWLYAAAIAEVGQVSTGASVGEGLDACLLARVKMPAAYKFCLGNFRGEALRGFPGTMVRRFRHEGIVVTETLGQHNKIRSYFAMFKHMPRGGTKPEWFAVSGNSWAVVRRVLDVQVGKVPSVLANDDFREFRTKLPVSGFDDKTKGKRLDEDVFVYFGAPAALALTDWRVQALEHEQKVVASHLRLLRNALASYARDRGKLLVGTRWPDTIISTLVEAGYLPGVPAHPGTGAYAFDPDLQVFWSTRYGRLGWLTPLADLLDEEGEPGYGKPAVGATAAQLCWDDEVLLTRAVTKPDPKDLKYSILRALAGEETSDFSVFHDLMQRPGLAVAVKSQLLHFGGGGLSMSKEKIALNFLANKVKGEIKRAIGWEDKSDPFAWAGDEVCVVLDGELTERRTALVDPALAFGVAVDNKAKATEALELIAKAPGSVERTAESGGPETITAKGWSMGLRGEDQPTVMVSRDALLLAQEASGADTALRRFLPEKSHVLFRYDTSGDDELVRTALGLLGPAAEEQAQLAMARFESLYGNRLTLFRLEDVPMLGEAPRPAGSQYFVEPIERRIASSVYGLPGDFLLCGEAPLDASVRKVLAQDFIAYGSFVLRKDSVEFVGAAPRQDIPSWKDERRPSSVALTSEVKRLRTTRSLDRLARAVLSSDGYLWRLGQRGYELDAARFEKRLKRAPEETPARERAREALIRHALSAAHPPSSITTFTLQAGPFGRAKELVRLADVYVVSRLLDDGLDGIFRWQRSSLVTGKVLRYGAGDMEMLLGDMGALHEREPGESSAAMAKLVGWSIICQGRGVADELRAFLEKPDEDFDWPAETIEFLREQAREYLRMIERQ